MKKFSRIMEELMAILAAGIGLLLSLAWHLFLMGWEATAHLLH